MMKSMFIVESSDHWNNNENSSVFALTMCDVCTSLFDYSTST